MAEENIQKIICKPECFKSGIEIISKFEKFLFELNNFKTNEYHLILLLKEAIKNIANKDFDNSKLIEYYLNHNKKNINFNSEYSSQNFIISILENINEEIKNCPSKPNNNLIYFDSIKDSGEIYKIKNEERIYPESKALYLFSHITKKNPNITICKKCKKELLFDYTSIFEYHITQEIKLNINSNKKLSEILKENYKKKIYYKCTNPSYFNSFYKCDEENLIELEIKFIKLPEILIFTLYDNNIIEPDKILEMKDFVDFNLKDSNTKYELFAINIRPNNDNRYEVCVDYSFLEKNRNKQIYFNGLFYRKINKNDNSEKEDDNELKEEEEEDDDSEDEDEQKGITYHEKNKNIKICGIYNYGNNCYLNSGLQIIARCKSFFKELENFSAYDDFIYLLYNAIDKLLNYNISAYDPLEFINAFCEKNIDFVMGNQCCSQTFIRTLINNVNNQILKITKIDNNLIKNLEYKPKRNTEEEKILNKFLLSKKIFPESKALSIFTGMTKSFLQGKCECGERIEEFSFNYFIDQNIYLDTFHKKTKFSKILKENIGKEVKVTIDCPRCRKEIKAIESTEIIKLPEILIFTLERYLGGTNNVEIIPNKKLKMHKYINNSIKKNNNYEYELFAINIRFGNSPRSGHEICQIKIDNEWFIINDKTYYKEKLDKFTKNSYGLFYKRKMKE